MPHGGLSYGFGSSSAPFTSPWAGWGSQFKSGQDRTSHYRARVHVNWPHECIDSILAKKTFTYKELTGSALAAGCVSSLFRTSEFYQCPEAVQVYLQHVSFLFHCLTYSNNTQAILDFHSSILSQIEAGLLTWSRVHDQTFTLQRLNFRASLKDIPASGGRAAPGNNNQKDKENKWKAEAAAAVCKDYGDGKCTYTADHDGKQHVCFHCWHLRGNQVPHPRNKCTEGGKRK